jgi:hypothetical protein
MRHYAAVASIYDHLQKMVIWVLIPLYLCDVGSGVVDRPRQGTLPRSAWARHSPWRALQNERLPYTRTQQRDAQKPPISCCLSAGQVDEAFRTMPPKRPCPFAYAMQHGKFPDAEPSPLQQRPEPQELTDTGNLWNAVPRRTCQYLDLEATQVDSDTSEGSTGSSDGSLSDNNFIDKEPRDNHTAEELQMLQRLFPKTFGCPNVPKHSPQSRYKLPLSVAPPESAADRAIDLVDLYDVSSDSGSSDSDDPESRKARKLDNNLPDVSSDSGSSDSDDPVSRKARKLAIRMGQRHDHHPQVLANGIIKFPVWKRGPVSSHPLTSGEKENVPPESACEEVD